MTGHVALFQILALLQGGGEVKGYVINRTLVHVPRLEGPDELAYLKDSLVQDSLLLW